MPPIQMRSALSSLQLTQSPYISISSTIPPPSRRTFAVPCSSFKPTTTTTANTRRSASSSTTTSSSSSQPSPIITSISHPGITSLPPTPPATQLTWNQYLQLRRTRRYYNLAASAATSVATTATGVSILSQQNIEALGGSVPMLDPFILLGLATAGSGAVGWLMGPFVGNAVFGIAHRKLGTQIAAVCYPFIFFSLIWSC